MACDFYDYDSEASHLAEIEDEDYSTFAMKFIKKSSAEFQAKKYKYNNAKVVKITKKCYHKITKI